MKTVAIIQARLGSTRLPNKVLRDVEGRTMIERVVARVEQSEQTDEIVIATTESSSDQPLVDFCNSRRWNVFRGSENDVLSRYVGAATAFSADQIVRITSDCPLIDPGLIDDVIQVSKIGIQVDYCCNFYPLRRYPRGLDCEVLTFETLNRIDRLATQPDYREHVTLYAYRNARQFLMGSVTGENDDSNLRWTVDTDGDLELIRAIYRHFAAAGQEEFNWTDIVTAYQLNPQWHEINQHILQKVA